MMMNENGPTQAEVAEEQSKAQESKIFSEKGGEAEYDIPLEVSGHEEVAPQDKEESKKMNDFEFSENFGHERNSWQEITAMINQLRFNCGMFVNNSTVQFMIVMFISINSIMMGIGTYDFVKQDPDVDRIFELVDKIFLIIFTVELGLQFIYHGWRLLLDGWLVFDLVIILTSWSFESVQIIRAFRIFRALRLVTRIKIMKNLILGE